VRSRYTPVPACQPYPSSLAIKAMNCKNNNLGKINQKINQIKYSNKNQTARWQNIKHTKVVM